MEYITLSNGVKMPVLGFGAMILSETLWKHLAEIDEECNEMMDRLVERMAKNEGVTEQLKSDDWLCWLQKMNSIKNANGGILKKSKSGIDRTEEMAYYWQ